MRMPQGYQDSVNDAAHAVRTLQCVRDGQETLTPSQRATCEAMCRWVLKRVRGKRAVPAIATYVADTYPDLVARIDAVL